MRPRNGPGRRDVYARVQVEAAVEDAGDVVAQCGDGQNDAGHQGSAVTGHRDDEDERDSAPSHARCPADGHAVGNRTCLPRERQDKHQSPRWIVQMEGIGRAAMVARDDE